MENEKTIKCVDFSVRHMVFHAFCKVRIVNIIYKYVSFFFVFLKCVRSQNPDEIDVFGTYSYELEAVNRR